MSTRRAVRITDGPCGASRRAGGVLGDNGRDGCADGWPADGDDRWHGPFGERVGDDDDCDDLPRRGDDCDDDVEIGPFLIELPLADGVTPAIALQVPAGTYEELELVLHTPDDDDAEDRAFLAAHPGFRRVSAIVEGRFNGQPFTYVTRTRAKYELEFAPPITFGPEGDRVTVDVNVGAWFARRGGGLISPIDASVPGEARARVEQNIRHTFRAFRDRNRDGRRDDR